MLRTLLDVLENEDVVNLRSLKKFELNGAELKKINIRSFCLNPIKNHHNNFLKSKIIFIHTSPTFYLHGYLNVAPIQTRIYPYGHNFQKYPP